jgi:hypothetical protein
MDPRCCDVLPRRASQPGSVSGGIGGESVPLWRLMAGGVSERIRLGQAATSCGVSTVISPCSASGAPPRRPTLTSARRCWSDSLAIATRVRGAVINTISCEYAMRDADRKQAGTCPALARTRLTAPRARSVAGGGGSSRPS